MRSMNPDNGSEYARIKGLRARSVPMDAARLVARRRGTTNHAPSWHPTAAESVAREESTSIQVVYC